MRIGVGMDLLDWGLPLRASVIRNYFILNIFCFYVVLAGGEQDD